MLWDVKCPLHAGCNLLFNATSFNCAGSIDPLHAWQGVIALLLQHHHDGSSSSSQEEEHNESGGLLASLMECARVHDFKQ